MLTAIDLQGMSQRDYAEQHGLNYSTLKSRVQKGRNDLRQAFEKLLQLHPGRPRPHSRIQHKIRRLQKC